MKTLTSVALATTLCCTPCLAGDKQPEFHVDHTRLDPQIIRIYSSGDNGTSLRQAMSKALKQARQLCRDSGYPYFYIVDNQTLYRQNQLTRQASYISRGYAETRGTYIGQGSAGRPELQGGNIDINYRDNTSVRRNRRTYSDGTTVNSNDSYLLNYSNKTSNSQQSWAAITIQMVNTDNVDGKHLYRAAEAEGATHE